MKIVFLGDFSKISTNFSQSKALKKICEVFEYDFKKNGTKNIVDFCKKIYPDLVLISKGKGISKEIIEELNKFSKTCLWYMDAVFHLSWNEELLQKIKLCNLVCCDKKKAVDLGRELNTNIFQVYEGFDLEYNIPLNLSKIYNVTFIGSLHTNRKIFKRELNFNVFYNSYNLEHSKIVSSSKINLNFCTNECASDRVYKVLASKGFLLSDDWVGREFEDEKEIVIFKNIKDLKEKVEFYLNNEQKCLEISENGYKKVLKYNREFWANEIINNFKKVCL